MNQRSERSVSVLEGYAQWAESYDAADNPARTMALRALGDGRHDPVGFSVVELGCGTGDNIKTLCSLGMTQYLGVDASGEMLAEARKLAANMPSHLRNVEVELAEHDVTQPLPLSREFDVALISLVLEHYENVRPVLEQATRLLHRDGQMWILEIHPWFHERTGGAHLETAAETLRLPSYAHTAEEILAPLVELGLEVERVSEWYPPKINAQSCRKLERYLGNPVLLDVRARRAS